VSKYRTPFKVSRSRCGVSTANHEVVYDDGPWLCRSEECDFIGDMSEGIAHIIANQFDVILPKEKRIAA
jgi:hypothetical protein